LQTRFCCVTVGQRDHCEEEMIMRALPIALLIAMPAFAQDKATIDKLNAEFMAAFAKGDMAALGQMYTEDAYLLPPGTETVKGRAAIQTFWTNAAAAIGDLKLTTVDVEALGGDAAREIGTFTLKTKGDKPQEVAGKYVVVWEKTGGQWKLATDIWNTNK
jgi:uncharacterized protein (TIGR02246 family)